MLNDDIEYKKSFEIKENILENTDEEVIVSENDSNSELKESSREYRRRSNCFRK